MTNDKGTSTSQPQAAESRLAEAKSAAEISLEDIDRLLEAEDPGFTKSLDEVRTVDSETNITIEASAIDELQDTGPTTPETRPNVFRRVFRQLVSLKLSLRVRLGYLRRNLGGLAARSAIRLLIFLKTKPKEYFLFSYKLARSGLKKSTIPLRAYSEASRSQKLAALIMIFLSLAGVWVLLNNMRGVWLPHLQEPVLRNLEPHADWVDTYEASDTGESFYRAFPQERHEFLFPKLKVNLKATPPENPLPMAALELIVLLDSRDTAIEVRDREVEFHDQLQRVCEEQTFPELETEGGKERLKSRIKHDLNQKLTQGWVKDVNFKTFILKP